MLLWIPVAIPLGIALKWHPFHQPTTTAQKLPLVASLYALAPVVIWGEALFDRVSFATYGLFWRVSTFQSLVLGFILGVLGLTILFAVQWRFGWLQIPSTLFSESFVSTQTNLSTSQNKISTRLTLTLLSTLGIGLWISFTEELVFRGFLPYQLQQDYAPWLAITVASLIFALLHLVWEGRENLPQLPGLWLMGIVLSIAYWANNGDLGLAIGLHTGWIWTIASLDTTQVIRHTENAPAWLTGLDGKPLAGLLGILFLVITAGLLWAIGVWAIGEG